MCACSSLCLCCICVRVYLCVCLRLCACVGVHATSMWESSSGMGSDPSLPHDAAGSGTQTSPRASSGSHGRLSEIPPHTCAVLFSRGSKSPVAVRVHRLGNLCWRLEQRCPHQVELQLPVTLRPAGGCPPPHSAHKLRGTGGQAAARWSPGPHALGAGLRQAHLHLRNVCSLVKGERGCISQRVLVESWELARGGLS